MVLSSNRSYGGRGASAISVRQDLPYNIPQASMFCGDSFGSIAEPRTRERLCADDPKPEVEARPTTPQGGDSDKVLEKDDTEITGGGAVAPRAVCPVLSSAGVIS